MKRKNLILLALIALSMVLFLSVKANAETRWFVCTVDMAGLNQSGAYACICLTDTASPPTFEKECFRCSADSSSEMLAIALTAMTNNMKVSINADPDQNYGYINVMFLLREEGY